MVIAGYIPTNSQLAAAIATHGKRLKYGKISKCFSKTGGIVILKNFDLSSIHVVYLPILKLFTMVAIAAASWLFAGI